jgi:pyruvate dehydrogenase E2 component (dihydrolipoamide acetyltransferase)
MPEVFMPRLSDTMTEGVITQWLKQEGDPVHRGDVLAEVETDKATMELEAYDEGVLTRILAPAGATVPIGEPIARIGDSAAAEPQPAPTTPAPPTADRADLDSAPPAAPPPTTPLQPTTPATAPAPPQPTAPAAPGAPPVTGAVRSSPLARGIARRHGIDLAGIQGSGPGGRIVRADVEAAVAGRAAEPAAAPPAPAPRAAAPAVAAPGAAAPGAAAPGAAAPGAAAPGAAAPGAAAPGAAAAAVSDTGQEDEEVALTAVRRVTARRLSESALVPHFDLTAVVDVAPLLAFRAQANDQLTGETRVSVTDLLVRACALALRAHPALNASWGGDKILRHKRIHIGIAVALDDGLIVPVIRDADRKSVREIATEAQALAAKARAGRLTPDEFSGGTFTISNLGMYGIDHFTAVLNPPEAAILAVGAATPQPVVRDGELVAGATMTVTLSVDHRVSDGASGATFLKDLSQLLEHPMRIVL